MYIYANEPNPVLARDTEQRRGQEQYCEIASVEVIGIPTGKIHADTGVGALSGKPEHEWICRVTFVSSRVQTHTGPMRGSSRFGD